MNFSSNSKKVLAVFFTSIFTFLYVACPSQDISSEKDQSQDSEKIAEWIYSGDVNALRNNRSFYILPEIEKLNISIGKDVDLTTKEQAVFLVKYNSSLTNDIPKDKIRYVKNATGVIKPVYPQSGNSRTQTEPSRFLADTNTKLFRQQKNLSRSDVNEELFLYPVSTENSSIAEEPLELKAVYEDGVEKNTVAESSMVRFFINYTLDGLPVAVKAKLLARGDEINVWGVQQYTDTNVVWTPEADWNYKEDRFSVTDENKTDERRFTPKDAENCRKKFFDIRNAVRTLYDEKECDFLFPENDEEAVYNGSGKKSMAEFSAFGNSINLLIYDFDSLIENDLTAAYFEDTMDYFINYGGNQGKLLYINTIGFKHLVNNAGSNELNLAHEYLHMLEFNTKTVNHGVFNYGYGSEMNAMMTMDLLSESELFWADNNPIPYYFRPAAFLSSFNTNYTVIGGFGGEDPMCNYYSHLYSFNAWLTRNYGGTKVARKIVTNSEIGIKSITQAVLELYPDVFKKSDGSAMNDDEVFTKLHREYLEAFTTTYSYGPDHLNDTYKTMNKWSENQDEIVYKGYKFPLAPINIFDLYGENSAGIIQELVPENEKDSTWNKGPVLLNAYKQLEYDGMYIANNTTMAENACLPLGYGMQVCKIGKIPAGTSSIQIEFSEPVEDGCEMLVIIGDNRKALDELEN